MNNKNYRVMKFFDTVNKQVKSRGYVRLDIRGIRGNIIVSVENLGDAKTTSEVYLYKDRTNKIKLGDINNKKGMVKKLLTFGSNNAIEDYNICAVVKDKKIEMYTNLFNACSIDQIRKLEVDDKSIIETIVDLESTVLPEEASEPAINEEEVTKPNVLITIKEDKEESIVKKIEKHEIEQVIEQVKKEQEIEQVKKEEQVKIEKEQDIKIEKEIEQDVKIEDVIRTDFETKKGEPLNVSVEDDRIKKTSVSSAVNMNVGAEDSVDEEIEEDSEVEVQSRKYKSKFDESLYNVLKEYRQVEPLSVKIKNLYWWYIPYDDTGIRNGFLPYYNQIISSYYPYPMSNRVTTCSGLMKRYGHYIFGIYKEKGDIIKFVYGVPGGFTKEEQPYKGVTGFKNWSYSNKDNYDKHGYWLAFVNPRTGETTEPPQIVLT